MQKLGQVHSYCSVTPVNTSAAGHGKALSATLFALNAYPCKEGIINISVFIHIDYYLKMCIIIVKLNN